MRRRLAILFLPLVALLWFLRPRVPTDHALHVHLGARAAQVREADLHFERDGRLERDLTLYFPRGAASDVERTVRLPRGAYEVGVRVLDAHGEERHVTRTVDVTDDTPIDLDLAVR